MEIKQHTLEQPIDQKRNWKIHFKKHIATNKNGSTTNQNLWVAEKAVLSRKFKVINAYIEKREKDLKETT